ncbi:MAG: hypothetical protein WB643_07325, partial [Candidatus Bathyarchaeia archaeon]
TKERASYLLMEDVRKTGRTKYFVSTSRLAFAEVLSVLIREYEMNRARALGVAYQYLNREGRKTTLTPDDRNDLSSRIEKFAKAFFEPASSSPIQYVDDNYQTDDVLKLIIEHKIHLNDAILVSTAFWTTCHYFITEDENLRNSLKGKLRFRSIVPSSSENFLSNIVARKHNENDDSDFLLLSHR